MKGMATRTAAENRPSALSTLTRPWSLKRSLIR